MIMPLGQEAESNSVFVLPNGTKRKSTLRESVTVYRVVCLEHSTLNINASLGLLHPLFKEEGCTSMLLHLEKLKMNANIRQYPIGNCVRAILERKSEFLEHLHYTC